MTFEEALVKAARGYYDGKQPKNLMKVKKAEKFSLEFFDQLEKELLAGMKKKPDTKADKKNGGK